MGIHQSYLKYASPDDFELGIWGGRYLVVGATTSDFAIVQPSEPLGEPVGHTKTKTSGETISKVTITNAQGALIATLSGLSISQSAFNAGLGIGTPNEGNNSVTYPFLVSLLDGNIQITGSASSDRFLEVGAGDKATVDSGKGDDKLFVWHQKTVDFDGGRGVDTILFNSNLGNPYPTPFKQQLVVDLDKGKGHNPYGGTLKLKHVENVVGTAQADKITGDDHANVIGDGAFDVGADTIKTRGGNDVVKVAPLSHGGVHADGGKGVDELQFDVTLATTAEGTTILDIEHPENNTGPMAGSVFKHFEKFTAQNAGGYVHHLDFRGSDADETVTGTTGFFGPAVSRGRDLIDVRGGDDRLDGHAGNDQLTGGPGRDTFIFDTVLNAPPTSTRSPISRPTPSSSTSPSLRASERRASWRRNISPATAPRTSDQHIVYDPTSGKLYYDADGSGPTAAVQFALLTNHAHLANTDFVVA